MGNSSGSLVDRSFNRFPRRRWIHRVRLIPSMRRYVFLFLEGRGRDVEGREDGVGNFRE